jgi:hypothetical protein
MQIVQLSRRWLLRVIPATAVALSSIGTTQADGLRSEKSAITNYTVALVSLIPHAPRNKKAVTLNMKAGERVSVRQYLGLSLAVEIEPYPLAHPVLDEQGQDVGNFYTVRLLDERGNEIKEMNIGNASTALFVDQELAVFLSEAT